MTLTRTASTSAQVLAMELGITDTAKKAKAYDLILALLTLERERDKWQPIETAPKDGTEILVFGYARCNGSRYANGQHVAWWDDELEWCGRDPDERVTLHPTHWRPLPSPPGESE